MSAGTTYCRENTFLDIEKIMAVVDLPVYDT